MLVEKHIGGIMHENPGRGHGPPLPTPMSEQRERTYILYTKMR